MTKPIHSRVTTVYTTRAPRQIEAFSATSFFTPRWRKILWKILSLAVSTDTEQNWNDRILQCGGRWCPEARETRSNSLSENCVRDAHIHSQDGVHRYARHVDLVVSRSKTSNISPHSSSISFNFRARLYRAAFSSSANFCSRSSFLGREFFRHLHFYLFSFYLRSLSLLYFLLLRVVSFLFLFFSCYPLRVTSILHFSSLFCNFFYFPLINFTKRRTKFMRENITV